MLRKFRRNMTNRGLNPQRLYLWMTQTSEILGVGFVNVHPVLAVADAVEVPVGVESRALKPAAVTFAISSWYCGLCFQTWICVSAFSYMCTHTDACITRKRTYVNVGGGDLWGFSCFITFTLSKIPRSQIYTDIVTNICHERTEHGSF